MTSVSQDQAERLRHAVQQLSAEATHLHDFRRARLMELAGPDVHLRTFYHVFPDGQFLRLRQAWLRQRIEDTIEAVFAQAQDRRDISIQRIADLAGCAPGCVMRQVGPSLQQRLSTLPDSQRQRTLDSHERIMLAIQQLVDAHIPLKEMTWARVYTEAASRLVQVPASVRQAFHNARETLLQYHEQQQLQRVPNATYAYLQGNWVNVDEPVWRLASMGATMRRDRLRPDIASLAWGLLREEALTTDIAPGTLLGHYRMALWVGTLLGETIPDVRAVTLASIQQVWCSSEITVQQRRRVRTMLVRILEQLLEQEPATDPLCQQEYGRVIHWLRTIRLRRPPVEKDFLSETELNAVLDGCFEDILQGLAYFQQAGTPVGRLNTGIHAEQAEPVLHWGVALMVLLMVFTGLRRQSMVRLQTDDLAPLGRHSFALAWKHGKVGKESVAIIPALVAEHLQYYLSMTAPVRARLGTPQAFVVRNGMRRWDRLTNHRFEVALNTFVRRHALKRLDEPLHLSSLLLRRTYVTRALYEMPSLAALQAQLGHNCIRTTLGYAQYDRYEHPAQVDDALDAFGRKVLVRWTTPLLLDDLPDPERQKLLEDQVAHEQDVGLCRQTCCVKLQEERLPPCSLCEHLVSGPAYLPAWEDEKQGREQQLARLAASPGTESLLAQLKGQYDRFLVNYSFVQERSRR